MKPMQLTYVKITNTCYKFFYENGSAYGEFYMDIIPNNTSLIAGGTATLEMKDPEYGKALMDGFNEALVKF
jgi:hypothetical protein